MIRHPDGSVTLTKDEAETAAGMVDAAIDEYGWSGLIEEGKRLALDLGCTSSRIERDS